MTRGYLPLRPARILAFLCYLSLAVVVTGVLAMAVTTASGACSRYDLLGTECSSAWQQGLAEYGMAVVVLSAFTVLPWLFAIAGAGLLVARAVKVWRLRR